MPLRRRGKEDTVVVVATSAPCLGSRKQGRPDIATAKICVVGGWAGIGVAGVGT